MKLIPLLRNKVIFCVARGTNSFIRLDDAEASTTSLLVSEQLMFDFRQHGLIENHVLHNYAGYRAEEKDSK